MKERPIIFSGPMVRAILDGRKTQTRRMVKPQPQPNGGRGLAPVVPYRTPQGSWTWVLADTGHGNGTSGEWCPYGDPGDRLFVRESLRQRANAGQCTHGIQHPPEEPDLLYAADDAPVELDRIPAGWTSDRENIPSIHMPRWASRILLEIVSVRVERADSISDADAVAESFRDREDFFRTFYDLNKRAPRGSNPWVWALTFRRVGGEG